MAVTDYQSLYAAVNKVALDGVSSIQSIGGYDTFIELYTQDDIDNNWNDIQAGNYDSNNNLITKCNFGDSDQSKIVLIASENIEIPEGYTLTPLNPKKSLVILCDKFINNGIVSMQAKGPNILPHEYYIIGETDGFDENVIIPAYANNQKSYNFGKTAQNGVSGNDGVNRQCGSGGGSCLTGTYGEGNGTGSYNNNGTTGSGSAFAGGGGSGCGPNNVVNSTYPMRGSDATYAPGQGGVGNTPGVNKNTSDNGNVRYTANPSFGVGGRIIIFCSKLKNNGTISANGVNATLSFTRGMVAREGSTGGASGGGAVDIFYNKLVTEGTITANGGSGCGSANSSSSWGGMTSVRYSGKGGNGSVTLTQYSAADFVLPGYADKKTLTKFVELVKTGLAKKADKTDVTQAIGEIIDDTIISYAKTYSSEKIEGILPRNITDLVNDAGFVGRHITAKEVRTIWDDTEV